MELALSRDETGSRLMKEETVYMREYKALHFPNEIKNVLFANLLKPLEMDEIVNSWYVF